MASLSRNKPLISICVPMFNEEESVDHFFGSVFENIKVLEEDYRFEIIVTDNHSTDTTFGKLKAWSNADSRIKVYRLSKNYGYQRSILTAYSMASGDAAIQLDCDLQDPPELIGEFLRRWREGCKVVYGVRRTRREGVGLHFIRRVFYRFLNYLSEDDLPNDAGDFRLIDRCIVSAVVELDDAQPYLRGTIAAMGFSQCAVQYDRRSREHGHSHFRFVDLLNLAIDGMTNHSVKPLRLASLFGILASVLSMLTALSYMLSKFVFGLQWPPGFATQTILILFSASMNSLFLGIIGEYIGRIYKQVKRTQPVLIEQTYPP